jgi:DNA (cytosine-5)-methyltransferase 1
LKLYEEILFLQGYFKGSWVVENVVSWYEPLITPQLLQRHYFWSNKKLQSYKFGKLKNFKKDKIRITGGKNIPEGEAIRQLQETLGINLEMIKTSNKRLLLRNCVNPELGKHILDIINQSEDKLL